MLAINGLRRSLRQLRERSPHPALEPPLVSERDHRRPDLIDRFLALSIYHTHAEPLRGRIITKQYRMTGD